MTAWLRRLFRRPERLSALPANRHLPDRVKAVIDSWEFQEATRQGLADEKAGRGVSVEDWAAYRAYRTEAASGRWASDPRD